MSVAKATSELSQRGDLSVHLVGSVPLADTETVFRTVCGCIGPNVRRMPDGETGARRIWVGMISQQLNRHEAFELDPDEPPFAMRLASGKVFREYRRLRIRAGIDPRTIRFETGYAAMAIDSFAAFDRLQREGVIAKDVRFQVSIPSPLAPTYNYISPKHRSAFLDTFTVHLADEVKRIAAALPNDRLALQWDVVHEILLVENYFQDRPENFREQITTTLRKIGDAVPEPIELGYHLCYGSPDDEHLVQPKDTAVMVELMHETLRHVRRPISYFHIPVPKPRTDPEFYRPLSTLSLPQQTELYLGLVHMNDDAGNRRRLELGRQVTRVAGVATECGWGRTEPTRIGELLESHRKIVGS